MQSPQVKQSNIIPLVFGGNMNSTLKSWLEQLGFNDFVHAQMNITSINPLEIQKSANYIRQNYSDKLIFTVGNFADKVLTAATLPHGALPSTSSHKLEVQKALLECKQFLDRRFNVQTNISPTECS